MATSEKPKEVTTATTEAREQDVELIYTKPSEPASFSGVKKVNTALRKKGIKMKLKDTEKELKKRDTYTLFQRPRAGFVRSRIMSPKPGYMWDADLMNMYSLSKFNKGYKYVLLCIDIFSRKTYTEALKTKNADDVSVAFTTIFDKALCKVLRTDAGKEFTASKMQQLFKEKGIKHYIAYGDGKASYSERCIRTIKNKLVKHMKHNNTYTWYDVLQALTESYNNTVHSSIGIEPNKVTKDNTEEVFQYQYGRIDKKTLKKADKRTAENKRAAHLKPGNLVRLAVVKGPFTKDYEPKWTEEFFTIDSTTVRDGVSVFRVKDLTGELVKGSYYGSELQKVVDQDRADGYYQIEKVVRTRKNRNGKKEFLVKFKNYSDKFNQWVPEESMTDI